MKLQRKKITKPKIRELSMDSDDAMESLLATNDAPPGYPPVLYLEYHFPDIMAHIEDGGDWQEIEYCIDYWALSWAIGQDVGGELDQTYGHLLEGK